MSEFQIRLKTELDDSKARSQLSKLLSDSKNNKVPLTADTTGLVASLNTITSTLKQINSMSKNINLGGNKAQSSGITSTLSQFKALTNQYNALQKQLSKETNPKSISVLKSQLSQVGSSIDQVKGKLSSTEKELAKAFSATSTQKLESSFSKTFSSISSKASKLGTEIKSAFNNPNMDMKQLNSLQTRFQGLQSLIKNFDMSKMSGESLNGLTSKFSELESKLKSLNTSASQVKLENKFNVDCSKTINQLEQLKVKYASLGKDTSGITSLINKTKELQSGIGNIKLGTLQNGLNGVSAQVNQMKSSLGAFTSMGKTVKSTFSQISQSFMMFAPGYMIGTALVSGIRGIKTEILELDKSMTNLKKVANDSDVATASQIRNITNNAVQIAKATAGSVSGIVQSMAEATKLGIKGGMGAAEEVAKYSQIFSNVGDMDVSVATQGIAQLINTFDINPLEKFKVSVGGVKKETTGLANAMDVLDFAGNKYSINVEGLLSAMQNGGATMASYGISIQESTALITAANASIQEPSRVGNGLKALSVNFAGLKTSAKDGSISMNKTAVALKNIAGIDIFTDKSKTTVKNMTTLLDEVNKKWDGLNDAQQKGLSVAIAGKTQSAVFNSLMKNYDQYKALMKSYSNGEHFNAAEIENAKYIDSINGKLASLKATWMGIASTMFNSDMLKVGVSGLDSFSKGISNIITTIDKLHLGIPATIGSIALLKTAFSSFKYAGSFTGGLSLMGMQLASVVTKVKGLGASMIAMSGLAAPELLLVGGAIAGITIGVGALIKEVDRLGSDGTIRWNELNKSVKEHEKSISKISKQEDGLSSKLSTYQELANVTNKTATQQKEYNKVLNDLAKIDPNLVIYDDKGSPIKARVGEIQDLIREYQKAQREHEKLLASDLKEKADISYEKYEEQSKKRNKEMLKLELLKRELLYNENKSTGKFESKLGDNWLDGMISGNESSIKNTKKYFDNLKKYKEEEQKAIDGIVKQRKGINKDESAWLDNLFSGNEKLETAGKKRKKAMEKAMENALKLDFSQFNSKTMDSLGNKMNNWFSTADYKDIGTFNKQIANVDKLNNAWKDGDISSEKYKNSVNNIAKELSKLTGEEISVEEFAKMLKIPEFDVKSTHKTFSDIEEAQNTLKSKLANMAEIESPKQRLKMAYDIIQDEKTPSRIKEEVSKLASDGDISQQDLEMILNLIGTIDNDDLNNTINKEIDTLSEEKEITKEIAITYASKIQNGGDFNQYLEELLGDSNLALDIQVHTSTGDLDALKSDLQGIDENKQIGIVVAAQYSGQYSLEQMGNLISALPTQTQTKVIANLESSGSMTPDEITKLINGLPAEVKKNITLTSNDNASPKVDKANNKKLKDKKANLSANDKVSPTIDKANNKKLKDKNLKLGTKDDASPKVDKANNKKLKDKKANLNAKDNASPKIDSVNSKKLNNKTMTITTIYKDIVKKYTGTVLGVGGSRPRLLQKTSDISRFGRVSDYSVEPTTLSDTSDATSPPQVDTPQISPRSAESFGGINTSPTFITKISLAYNNVLDIVKRGINLFQELENRIKGTNNQMSLLSAQMDKTVGTTRISQLETQNKLYEEQSRLQKELYSNLSQEKNVVKSRLGQLGFTFDWQGNLRTYEEQLLSLEKAYESAQKKESDYTGSSENTKKKLANATKSANDKLDEAKKLTQEYLDIQYNGLPGAEEEWQKLQNAIKENNNAIEQLKFEDTIYREKHAVEELTNSYGEYSDYLDKVSKMKDRYTGKEKLNYMRQEVEYTRELIDIQKKMISQYGGQRDDYKYQLGKYGVGFTGSGQISNYDETLNKYQNSSDYEKIKKWMEEYSKLLDTERDASNTIEGLENNIQDLNNEIKIFELDDKIKDANNSIGDTNQRIDKLNNKLSLISVKLKNASGMDKINLLNEQIELWKQLSNYQQDSLKQMTNALSIYQNELNSFGFKFDASGNITNMESKLDELKDSANYDYIKDTLDKWEELYENGIPKAEESIEDYENAIKDANNSKLEITKSVEDKITDMIKSQLEKRKEAIKKQADEEIKLINKKKDEYNKMRDEMDYEDDYDDQMKKINKLNQQIEMAKRDDSLSGKAKLEELLNQLDEENKKLQELVQEKIDKDINDMFDEESDKIKDDADKKAEDLDNEWTEEKIANAVKDAIGSGVFTDLEGNVIDLKDAMIDFAKESGDAFGVLGDKIKKEMLDNLIIAQDVMKDLSNIYKELDITSHGFSMPNQDLNIGRSSVKQVAVGDSYFSISGNINSGTMKDIEKLIDKKNNDLIKEIESRV